MRALVYPKHAFFVTKKINLIEEFVAIPMDEEK